MSSLLSGNFPLIFLFIFLFGICPISAQNFYDSGERDEGSTYLRFNQVTNNYELLTMSYEGIRTFDSTVVFQRLIIDTDLSLIDRDTLNLQIAKPFNYHYVRGIDSVSSHVMMGLVNPKEVGYNFKYLGKRQLCRISKDSIYDCITYTHDSAYGVGGGYPWFQDNSDTVRTIATYALGKLDSVRDQYLVKIDTSSGSVVSKKLDLTYQGAKISIASKPVKSRNDKLVAVCFAEEKNPQKLYGGVAVINSTMDSVLSFTQINTPGSEFYSLWVKNDKAIVYFRGARLSTIPNYNLMNDLCIEEVDLSKDTLTKKHFYPLTKPNPDFGTQDISGPVSYFDGEYFILPSTLNTTPLAPTNRFKTMMIGVDTSYNLITRDSIMDYTNTYYGAVWSIIPEPDSSGNYIYAGLVQGHQIAGPPGNVNAFWSKFRIKDSGIGVEEITRQSQLFSLYPNPNSGRFKICGNKEQESCEARVIDIPGRVLHEERFTTHCHECSLNLPKGTYLLEVIADGKAEYLSFIVK